MNRWRCSGGGGRQAQHRK